MEVFALGLKVKEEGAATVSAALLKVRSDLNKTAKESSLLDKSFAKMALGAIAVGAAIGGVVGALTLTIRNSVEAQKVQAQLASALESTGADAWTSIDALNAHAAALQRVTAYGDEAIGEAQALLLTFKEISGSAFPRATEAVLDVAQAMGGDLKSASLQVGKALNDPILGVTALARSGIQFTVAQKAMIKSLVETGKLAEAQTIILKELESQFGGSAKAARDTLGGALASLNNAWGDLFEVSRESSGGIIAAIEGITTALPAIRDFIEPIIRTAIGMGATFVTSINVIYIAMKRALYGFGGFLTNIVLAPLTLLPFIGQKILRAVDLINLGLSDLDTSLANDQAEWKDWETGVYRGLVGADAITGGLGRTTKALKATTDAAVEAGRALRALPVPGAGTTKIDQKAPSMHPHTLKKGGIVGSEIPGFGDLEEEARTAAGRLATQLQEAFADGVASSLVAGFALGIEQAIASGSIGEGFNALIGTMLSGIGSAMIQFGTAALMQAKLMQTIMAALSSLTPAGAIGPALAMIAAGAALKGVARGMFGGSRSGGGNGGGGGGPSFGSSSSSSGGDSVTRLLFGATSAGTAAGMQPRQAMNITIIGPDDPTAQRAIQELITKSARRGGL